MSDGKNGRKAGEAGLRLGKRIRALRTGRNLSQERLAGLAGLSAKFLGEVERGQGNISIDKLEKIAAALQMGLNELIEAGHELSLTELRAEIARLTPKLSPTDAKIIYRTMKIMAEARP
ncbi:MAG: helix-turn-helix domain-containing protein [Deltaproteobacteria bacterium]|jgi:transcriptional regulator with XRE-family HTH domain|nr:helix-turn-helix domain-containing protein [Deltaproteobacteria bacterium]